MRKVVIEKNGEEIRHKVTESLPVSPAMARRIAETGSTTRKKAIKLGILPNFEKLPPTIWVDKASGDGYKEFEFLSPKTLHEELGAELVTWCVLDHKGEVLLSSPTW